MKAQPDTRQTDTPQTDTAQTGGLPGAASSVGSRCACYNLRRASRAVTRFYDSHLAPSGLRATQFSILAATSSGGPMTMSVLAERLGTERTTLTRNLGLLEARGFISPQTGQDRREHRMGITPAGRAALDAALPFWRKAQAVIEEQLGQDRLERVLEDLAALTRSARG